MKKFRISLAALAAVAMAAMTLTACDKTEPETIKVTGVTLNKTTLALVEGASETLTATVAPVDAENKAVMWKSSDESVATVSGGAVSAKKAGTATITVTTTDGAKTATCAVTVTAATVTVTGVSLNKTTLALEVGGTETLTATVAPDNASDKTVTWKSDKTDIADVDGTGKVTAKKAGTATITATSAADATKTATCAVTVTAPAENSAPIGKWNVGANASGIVSVEFGVSGDYVVVVDEPLTRAEANYVAYYGTYTFSGNKATLSGFGSITIRSLEQDAIAFTLERENGGSVELNGEKAEEMDSSTKTDLLCRTWKIVAYEDEDGYHENKPDPNDDEWPQYVFFSKAGTYLVTYFGGGTNLSNWKWKSEANGTLHYSHDFPPEWTEDATVTITTLTNDKCVIDEQGVLYYLELK